MKKYLIVTLILSALFVTSCGSGQKSENLSQQNKETSGNKEVKKEEKLHKILNWYSTANREKTNKLKKQENFELVKEVEKLIGRTAAARNSKLL